MVVPASSPTTAVAAAGSASSAAAAQAAEKDVKTEGTSEFFSEQDLKAQEEVLKKKSMVDLDPEKRPKPEEIVKFWSGISLHS